METSLPFAKRLRCGVGLPVLLLGFLMAPGCRRGDEPDAGGPPAVAAAYTTVKYERVLLTNDLPGRTAPCLMAEVRPQVSGIIRRRLFTEGAEVEAGDVLYEIDPSSYRATVANAEAALAAARAEHATALASRTRAVAGRAAAEATVEVASAALSAARAARSRAEANAVPLRLRTERFRELVSQRAVSRQDFDDVSAALDQAEAAIESADAAVLGAAADLSRAEAAIRVSEAEIGMAEAAVEAALAAIQSAEAGLESAGINLEYTRIAAPISGHIGRSSVTVGALVTAHQPVALATIRRLDPIYVDVPQANTDLLRIRRGLSEGRLAASDTWDTVELMLEDGTRYPHKGELLFSEVAVDPSTGSYVLRLTFPNPDRVLLPGVFVRAVLEEGVDTEAVLVPQQCVTRDAKGDPFVLIIGAENKVEQRGVTVDRSVDHKWLVSSGLRPGDRVLVEGSQKAKAGAVVDPVPVQAESGATGEVPGTPPQSSTDTE
jgi:membrane fusion protein (multidrug efflux system)